MKIQVIQVPYDSGNRSVRMGSGPEHFIRNGLPEGLRAEGHEVSIETVEAETEFRAEIRTQFELYGLLAERVRQAHRDGRFPLILSGNCGATLGAIAGAENARCGLIWFDAHGDFNTPETTTIGFLDGMGLAIATGLCWSKLASSIPGFRPISGKRILHIGGRDFDPEERDTLVQAGATIIDAAAMQQSNVEVALKSALSGLRGAGGAHLHLDLDVLNPKEAPANGYATEEGGLGLAQVAEAIAVIKKHLKITSATVAAFDPNFDPRGKTLQAGSKLIREIVGK